MMEVAKSLRFGSCYNLRSIVSSMRFLTNGKRCVGAQGRKDEGIEYSSSSQKTDVTRYTGPLEHELNHKQREIRDDILRTRTTGLAGPFGVWLSVPGIASPAQELGRACRYETSLSFRESELIILLTGARFNSHTEFEIHRKEAERAGLPDELINAVYSYRGDNFNLKDVKEKVTSLLSVSRERAIAHFAIELLCTSTVSESTYSEVRKDLRGDDVVLVEITSIVGYYTFVAFTLNAFNVPIPSGDDEKN